MTLQGARVFILRSVEQNQVLSTALQQMGAEVISYPTLCFQPIVEAMQQITLDYLVPFDSIAFTSVNAVHFFIQALAKKEILDYSMLAHKTWITVGSKTAECLISYAIRPSLTPEYFSSEGILQALPLKLDGRQFLLPAASEANPKLGEQLRLRGAAVTQLKLYRTSSPNNYPPATLRDGDYVLFTSPSTVNHFFESPLWNKQAFIPFCLGPFTAQALQQKGQTSIVVSSQATVESLIEALQQDHKMRSQR